MSKKKGNKIIRKFNVTVLSIPIVYDFFGDYDPNGMMYVLSSDKKKIKDKALVNFNNKDEKGDPLPIPTDEVQPLTIRANVGDTIRIKFHHNENRRLSIHMQGLEYKNIVSDGAYVGLNQDSTVGPGEKITYEWYADKEGIFYFSDMGDTRSSEEGTNIHGLFGALIVEAKGSMWTDPVDGSELKSGLFADIHNPFKESFREYAVYFHDELEMVNRFGGQIIDHHTNQPMGVTAISYRSEPMVNRAGFIPPKDKGFKCCNPCNEFENCNNVDIQEHNHMVVDGEDVSMSSWVYGDPSTFIPRAYKGDPSKFRLIHGGVLETHVFHLHAHQWKLEPDDPKSTIIDSISISPQESYTIDILNGAGSLKGAIGDHIWHCHLYPHFHEGMWSLWRVFDRLETGKDVVLEDGQVIHPVYPDGTYIKELKPLPDREAPPKKDLNHPGYPNFINGKFRERMLQPPLGVLNQKGQNKICPTDLEKDNFVEDFTRGALYAQPCPFDEQCGCRKKTMMSKLLSLCTLLRWKRKCQRADVTFELFALQANIEYNNAGWHDPYGRFFVTKEQIEEYTKCKMNSRNKEALAKKYVEGVEKKEIEVEPLVIRANAEQCIEVRFTNFLPEMLPKTEFQLETITDNAGFHIHLVKFDVITADGGANGYNNGAYVYYGETLIERYYADQELNACFFHDHFNPNSHQQHGVFGALIVEPKGSTYHHPKTGKQIKYGTKAVIKTPCGRKFREFALFVHDFALLFDKEGNALNPPPFSGSHDDPGVMGINYKCEPLRERLGEKDSAYVFSSKVHGDPVTPILETYPGDEVVIRLLDGAQEEQHAFNINGMKWRKEITDKKSPLVQEQTLGISEAFNIRLERDYSFGDYIYYFGGQDDFWLGLWGIIRVYKEHNKNLMPINKCKIEKEISENKDIKIREYHIAAIQKDIKYNEFKDHDPDGLMFVPYEYKDKVLSGEMEPIPLVLRAKKGEYIKVTLTNCFEKPIPYQEFPGVPVDKKFKPSMRVGISPQFVKFDPIKDSGVNVGYNSVEQTVAPGESKEYLWYADKEYGTCLISSFTDIRNHRYHGLFGAIIIEPEDSEIEESYKYSEQITIKQADNNGFREFVIFMHNGIRLLDDKGNLIKTNQGEEEEGEEIEPVDFEDRGEKGFNYRSERFFNRLQEYDDISKVFSSKYHKDPSTPIFEVEPGERVIIRLLMPGDKPRNVCFVLHGHEWKAQPEDPFTRIISTQGAISVGNVFNIELIDGASTIQGDYLYRAGNIKWDIESGMWGILRIKEKDS